MYTYNCILRTSDFSNSVTSYPKVSFETVFHKPLTAQHCHCIFLTQVTHQLDSGGGETEQSSHCKTPPTSFPPPPSQTQPFTAAHHSTLSARGLPPTSLSVLMVSVGLVCVCVWMGGGGGGRHTRTCVCVCLNVHMCTSVCVRVCVCVCVCVCM